MDFLSCEISISNNLVRPPNHSEKFIVHILGVKTRSTDFSEVMNLRRNNGNTQTEAAKNSGIVNDLRNDTAKSESKSVTIH